MNEDRSLLVTQQSAYDQGIIASYAAECAKLRRELAQAKETAATSMRVAQTKQRQLDERDRMLVRYCQTIDAQLALISDLVSQLTKVKKPAASAVVHEAIWPPFPASALSRGDGIFRG